MRLLAAILLLVVGAVFGLGIASKVGDPARRLFGGRPDVATIAAASLASVQTQARLTAFAARFTVAITSEQRRLGLAAKKTMIVPGLVRYEFDWARLGQRDLAWNASQAVLVVNAPQIEIARPAVEMNGIREYASGGILMALTDAEGALDDANRAEVDRALLREAANPTLVRLARDATRAAIARTFQLPLAAAGMQARVLVRFPGEAAAT